MIDYAFKPFQQRPERGDKKIQRADRDRRRDLLPLPRAQRHCKESR